MEEWLVDIMSEYGYLGIVFLIALENVFPPIPSEVILTFAGFMTISSDLSIFGVVISATVGSVMGATILYRLGLQLDSTKLEELVSRWGYLLRLSVKDIQRMDAWFGKHGVWAVFFCRLIPMMRTLISIPAGMARMNVAQFLLYTTLGSMVWNITLVSLGASIGGTWDSIIHFMEIYSKIIYIGVLILGLSLFVYLYKRKNDSTKVS